MTIVYQYDEENLEISEQPNDEDREFLIKVKNQEILPALRQVRNHFDQDRLITDVLFFTHKDHHIQVIVRKDFYVDFILSLFKHQVIKSIAWN